MSDDEELRNECEDITQWLEGTEGFDEIVVRLMHFAKQQRAAGLREAQNHFDLNFTTIMGFSEWLEAKAKELE